MNRVPVIIIQIAIANMCFGALVQAADIEVTTIVLQHQPNFEYPEEELWTFGGPRINNSGAVLFSGRSSPSPGSFKGNLYLWQDGHVSIVARQGWPIPGHPSMTYGSQLHAHVINDANEIAFTAQGVLSVLMVGTPDELAIVAMSGSDPNPPRNPQYLTNVGSISGDRVLLTQSGAVAFRGGTSIYSGLPGQVELLISPGDQAAGYPRGIAIQNFSMISSSSNGQVFSGGILTSAGVYPPNTRAAIWVGPDGNSCFVGPDQQVPGMDADFTAFERGASINSEGVMGFLAFYMPKASKQPVKAAFVGTIDDIQPIAQIGDKSPGIDGVFGNFHIPPIITKSGEAALMASVVTDRSAHRGVWMWDGESMDLLLLEGDPIANVEGAVLDEFSAFYISSNDIAVNNHRQLAFKAVIETARGETKVALLLTDPDSGPHVIATVGDLFEVAPNEFREVSEFGIVLTGLTAYGTSSENGRGTCLNDDGILAFHMSFEDGTVGIFTASISEMETCPPDLNGDGVVNQLDVLHLIFQIGFGQCPANGECLGDFNGDGVINGQDVSYVATSFGSCP